MSQTCTSVKQIYKDSQCCGASDTEASACGPVKTGIMKNDLAPSTVRTYFPVRSSRVTGLINFVSQGHAQQVVDYMIQNNHAKTFRVGFGTGETGSYQRDTTSAVFYMTCERGSSTSQPACVESLKTRLIANFGTDVVEASLIILNPEDVAGGHSINTYATDTSVCEKKSLDSIGRWGDASTPSPKEKLYSMVGIANFTYDTSLPEYNASIGAYLNYEHRICTTEGFMLTYTFYQYKSEPDKGALVYNFESLYSLDRHIHAANTYPTGGFMTWGSHLTGYLPFGTIYGIVESSSNHDLEIDYFNFYNSLNYSRVGFDTVGTIDTCEIV